MGRKKILHGDPVQFRPGADLGELIADFAQEKQLTHGEAAKRLVSLALHDLPLAIYPFAAELMAYLPHPATFDAACQTLVVHAHGDSAKAKSRSRSSSAKALRAARRTIDEYRTFRKEQGETRKTNTRGS